VAVADAGNDANPHAPLAGDRYADIVASLLGSRTDHAGARFDAELAAAVTAGRLDQGTARTLRWWQRESVRAAEEYATTVVPPVLAARDSAEASAASDAAEAAASWRQAESLTPTPGDAGAGIRWNHPTRLVAVPQLADRTDRADQQAAVRAAFRSPGAERKDDDGHAHPATSA
jgi:hypothetical protein